MENENVKLGMKVVPHSKSYAQDLHNSQHWKMAKEKGWNYLYVNFIHTWHTHGKVFVLGFGYNGENLVNGDFFLASDFEPFED